MVQQTESVVTALRIVRHHGSMPSFAAFAVWQAFQTASGQGLHAYVLLLARHVPS